MNPEQEQILKSLKAHFPYRIVFGALSPDGQTFETYADHNKRRMNKLLKEGWQVWAYTHG